MQITPQTKSRNLIDNANFTINIGDYTNQSRHDHRDFMLANASEIIAYHNGKTRNGTGSTLRKVAEQGLEVENLHDTIKFVANAILNFVVILIQR